MQVNDGEKNSVCGDFTGDNDTDQESEESYPSNTFDDSLKNEGEIDDDDISTSDVSIENVEDTIMDQCEMVYFILVIMIENH